MTESEHAQIINLDEGRRRMAGAGRERCLTVVAGGRTCRNYAGASGHCRIHEPAGGAPPAEGRGHEARAGAAGAAGGDELDDAIANALAFLRRRLSGDYAIDAFGFDRELTEQVMLPLARPLYHRYWRVRAVSLEHVPDEGPALVVANHSGTLPFDAVMTKMALLDEHPARRHLRELAADLALKVPVISSLARKSGSTLACGDDARRLLAEGELVGVWPEGYKGLGKPYRDRYRLQRFGRGGFVGVALRAQVPIIPTAIIGAEEIYPMLADVRWLARLLSLPYLPVTPTFPLLGPLGAVPLPTKWVIDFGEPIDTTAYGPEAADDPMAVFELTDRVRDTIQQMLYRNLMGRRSIFF
ncbi:MAG: lysophospholipid acyltransferase family protein [Egibacteraceae bacterium]